MAIAINAVVSIPIKLDDNSIHNLNLFDTDKKQGHGGLRSRR